LSASIRTDHQYATEEQKGWDQQWGKIFGAEHNTGDARITDYYKQNSPYHLIKSMKAEDLRKIAFFMENGDKENTLCRSNEDLHMLMVEKDIPHVYHVRAGAHEFKFWCEAIPEAFRFADCSFTNKPYKEAETFEDTTVSQRQLFWKEEATFSGRKLSIFYPENPISVKRNYPTVYFVSSLDKEDQEKLISLYQQDLQKELLAPIIFCFVQPDPDSLFLRNVIQYMEKNKSSREGRRFRAVWSYQNGGANVLEQALTPDQFTACVFTDSNLQIKLPGLEQLIADHESIKDNIRWYIDTPPSGDSYLANGYLHINLREHGFIHEYRVRHNYKDDFSFLLSGFSPAISYVSKRFHN